MLIIRNFFPTLSRIKILELAFKGVNLKVLKNVITFWFYN